MEKYKHDKNEKLKPSFSSCPCALQFVDVCCTDSLMTGLRWMARTISLTNASPGGKLGRAGNVLFLSDPHFSWKDCPAWCSHGRGMCRNRIMQLFDLGMVSAKTPSENLASGRLLCSRSQNELPCSFWNYQYLAG